MHKTLVGAALCVAAVLGGGTAASAGEWNPGRGYIFSPPNATAGEHSEVLVHENDDTAVGPAASVCSFSGRDDTDTGDNGLWSSTPAGGLVQSPGQVVAIDGDAAGVPGLACRGS